MTEHLVVTSGGLDSTTLLYDVMSNGSKDVKAISFDYGQRHKKELIYAKNTSERLGIEHSIVDITAITSFLAPSGSALVSGSEVPDGHYAEENMKQTVVPNRNMIMASIAAGHAVAIGAKALWMGVHAGDHFIYPDCRPRFFNALNAAVVLGNEGFGCIPQQPENSYPSQFIQTPYIDKTKADIASLALYLKVPLHETWSCYKGGDIHCGRCGTCVERIEAIQEAIGTTHRVSIDTTEYEDGHFWKEALERDTV